MTSRARAILWDLGHTLVDWDPKRLYRKLLPDEASVEAFLSHVCTMDWHARHDAGVSMADNRKHLMQAHPDKTDLIMAWEHRWDEMFDGPVGRMDEVFLAAHDARVPQYAISNLPAEKWEPLKAMYPYLHHLDEAVISGEEKVIKPDPEIYEITIKRIATPPQETVFIDDRLDNIEAAEAFGFLTIHFTDERKTRSRLRDLGLDIPAI